MDALNWALMTLTGSCNTEMAMAGLDLAKLPIDLDNEEPAKVELEPEVIRIEDDGSSVLKLLYQSFPGSTLSRL